MNRRWTLTLVLLAAACDRGSTAKPGSSGSGSGSDSRNAAVASQGSGSGGGALEADPAPMLDSADILARTEVSSTAHVKHVLIGWKDLAKKSRAPLDPRAAARTVAEAAALATETLAALRAKPSDLDRLVAERSEDPGSKGGSAYVVDADEAMVPSFLQLALRLRVDEAGIVASPFGYHVMQRVAPHPLEPAAVLARRARGGDARVRHILIAWKDVPTAAQRPPGPRALGRTAAEAEALAKDLLAKIAGGADPVTLVKEFSDDAEGAKDGGELEVPAKGRMIGAIRILAQRLADGEAGLALSPFGWHLLVRLPPPPPDPVESADILAREPVTQASKVKHVLLGWTEVNAGDPRAVARSRKDLETLVKTTLAKLRGGAPIDPIMKELSEDPGSAASGESYDVTPNAGLVEPFKALGLRLKVGETGAVRTRFGIHLIQRVE